MATLFSLNDGNLTDPNVFGQTMSAGDYFDGTNNLNITTSYTDPSINIYNILSDGSSISAIAVNVNYRSASPTGTLSMLLSSGGSFVTETYAISSFTSYDDRNNLVSNASQNWQILKLSTPFASTSGNRIRLDFSTSDADQLAFVGTLTAFENFRKTVGTFNGTFTQSDSPFVNTPLETAYRFSSSQANFENYNDAVFGTGDFTVELWFKLNSITTYVPLILKGTGYQGGSPGNRHDWFLFQNSGKIYFTRYADIEVNTLNFSYTPVINTWTHIAACRKNGLFTIYINGISIGSFNDTTNFFNSTNLGIQMGASYMANGWQYLNGSITNARVVAGKALYLSNFTVPSSPLLLDSGTTIANYKSPTSPTYVSDITPFSGVNAEDGSLFFGTTDYLKTPSGETFNFASTNFTIEFWLNVTSLPSSLSYIITHQNGSSSNSQYQYLASINASNKLQFSLFPGTSFATVDSVTAGVWTHYACVRNGTTATIFVNGLSAASISNVPATLTDIAGGNITIGGDRDESSYKFSNGYISNLRVSNTNIYNSNFPALTAPLENLASTRLLLKAPYSPFTYGTTGTPTLSSASPFGVGTDSSVRFNGAANSYLQSLNNSTVNFATKSFTMEFWLYVPAIPSSYKGILVYSNGASANYNYQYGIYLQPTGIINFNAYWGEGNSQTNTSTPSPIIANTWTHYAWVRNGTTSTVYVNGVSVVTNTLGSATLNSVAGASLYIGSESGGAGSARLEGSISNLRLSDTNVYNANFNTTAPISPLTPLSAVASTVLLMKDAYDTRYLRAYNTPFLLGSYGNVNKGLVTTTTKDPTTIVESGTLTKTGTLPLSSASPFGVGTDSSIYFANPNYITVPSNNLNSDSNDFTIECWFILNASGSYYTIFSFGDYRHDNGLLCRVNTVGSGNIYNNSADSGSWGAVSINQWHHLAICRVSGSTRVYINGTLRLTSTINSSSTLRDLYIGTAPHDGLGTQGLNGNISNFRIVKNVALYTSNFTVPTAPLTAITNTSLLYNHPYGTTYSINNAHNLHVAGALKGLTSELRVLTASTIGVGDVFVHNQGKLLFPSDSSKQLTVYGSKGLQITSDGTLEIGTANEPISSTVQHSIVLNNTQIDVHNGGNMNVYGSYKKPFTYLTSDSLSSSRTFTAVDTVSTNWSVGDSVVFTPNTFQANSFDVLTLSSFDSGSTFRTTASAAFNHPSVTSLGNVPTVSNLSRNISIRETHLQVVLLYVLLMRLKLILQTLNLLILVLHLQTKPDFVVGVNSSGYVSLSGNAFNSDGFVGTTHITTISSKPVIGSLTLRDNVFFRSGGNGVSISSVSASALTVTGNTLLSSNSSGLFFASVSSSGITMSDNTVIGARSNGTFIANSNINGDFTGVVNYRNGNSGLVLSASQCGSLNNLVSIHNVGEGIYVDGSIPGLSNTTFSNITASNNEH
jgi:hypothetical protein